MDEREEKSTRKCCSIGKFLTFIIIQIAIIVLTCFVVWYFLSRAQDPYRERRSRKVDSPLTLSKFLGGSFHATEFNGSWISDDEIFMMDSDNRYVTFNVTNKTKTVILDDVDLIKKANQVELSADKNYLIILYDLKKGFRWSSKFSALIYDIRAKTKRIISNSRNVPLTLQLIKWAPVGNSFVYIYENDIYYRPSAMSTYENRLTYSGSETMVNGICDWVYEEEIFGDSAAVWFSPDGENLAYATFNDRITDVMPIIYYGNPGNLDSQYPQSRDIHYPKPGRVNPMVRLSTVSLRKSTIRVFQVENQFPEQILTAVNWVNNDRVAAVIMNRVQNRSSILICESYSGYCKQILYLENEMGWVEFFTPPVFSKDGESMLYIYSSYQNDSKGGYRHLTLYNFSKKSPPQALTQGQYTVLEILAWDHTTNIIYFTATEENKPMNQQIYKIAIKGSTVTSPECLSCNNTNSCNFSTAKLSSRQTYRVQTCSGPNIPSVAIYNQNNEKVLSWEENEALRNNLKGISLPEKRFLTHRVAQNVEANILMLIPSNIDKSGRTKYPLLVYVYGGPQSNAVMDVFKINWVTYFSVNYNVVIAIIDGSGSGRNGDNVLFANYRTLGNKEILDQINVTKYLIEKMPYIDETKVGIWGWSYGGYAAGMVLAKDSNNLFKCGASVAPVTDWIYYDSMYTERFMGLPTANDNLAGYNASSLIRVADKLARKNYLLVHGTFDDNVHLQNSMMLARSLQQHNAKFTQQIYTDETHSLERVNQHLFETLGTFFEDCFS